MNRKRTQSQRPAAAAQPQKRSARAEQIAETLQEPVTYEQAMQFLQLLDQISSQASGSQAMHDQRMLSLLGLESFVQAHGSPSSAPQGNGSVQDRPASSGSSSGLNPVTAGGFDDDYEEDEEFGSDV